MLGRPARGDLWIVREVLVEETYKPILPLLPTSAVRVVDVGAHIGAFTVWLHRSHGISEGFCVEPDAESFAACQFNLRMNACSHVNVQQLALGGTTREGELWADATTHARNSLQRRASSTGQHGQTVQVVAFSDWLSEVPGQFDLLKLDCEGAEWEMLDAAPEVFSRFNVIVAEIHHDPTGAGRNGDFLAGVLAKLGFHTIRCDSLYVGRRLVSDAHVNAPDAAVQGT
jgi:FkbM family methyltransferase